MSKHRSVKTIQQAGTAAVRKLREEKLKSGQPFMINSRLLPKGQCYLEFPDGRIKLVSISSTKTDFNVIEELSPAKSLQIRRRFHFIS